MQLNKGKYIATLKEPLFQLLEANLHVGTVRHALILVRPYDIAEAIRKQPRMGPPEMLAMENGQHLVTVYPIPDRRYQCELIGTRVVTV
jgi:hypothetical protein